MDIVCKWILCVSINMKKEMNKISQIGRILSIKDNIITANGLDNAFLGEVVQFKNLVKDEHLGQIYNLEKNLVKIVLIKGNQKELNSNDLVFRTYNSPKTRVGFSTLGKILTPLGEIINYSELSASNLAYEEIMYTEYEAIEKKAPSIIERESIKTPFLTGINVIDTFLPIGCGQRELIIGDLGTGKTSLALTAILNQARYNNYFNRVWREVENNNDIFGKAGNYIPCIYVGIGQKRSEIARIKQLLTIKNVFNFTTIVFTSSDQPASIQFLAPYAGCTIGEWYRDKGYRALIIYDELSQHAVAYRQMSLLLRRPPGREAYPGDIFYVHSRLLERAAQMRKTKGAGALTALPIVETKGGDISAYVPTNIISITDGQIFLSKDLANKGVRPAVSITLSVSRVGSNAQTSLMRDLSRKLKADYSFYTTYKGIDKLGGDVDAVVSYYLKRGLRTDEYFKQDLYNAANYGKQVISIYAISNGLLDRIPVSEINNFFDILFNNSFKNELAEDYLTAETFPIYYNLDEMDLFLYCNDLETTKSTFVLINKWIINVCNSYIKNIQ
uniref:ATP synthase F1 subunit alpha n=1 Tax=Acrasis kona TaxID=1008807 RepID=A0A0B4MZE5_9EUKA|nr:ATP synthase F1 subunit alpha [Acrasis kona]AID52042.1 ATP synthase F1 subunit alpha [Acrasis kona]